MSLNSTAVMQRRLAPAKGLDYFPTPPWATRAFMREVLFAHHRPEQFAQIWEPAAGQGHMAHVLSEFGAVRSSDVHDYGCGFEVGSFVGQGLDVAPDRPCDWIITNPPFNLAEEFLDRALRVAGRGVALLLRTSWLEGEHRFENVFLFRPPSLVAQYVERVPMTAGAWNPKASSATSYAWFVWDKDVLHSQTLLRWIAPGARRRNHEDEDVKRWFAS